MTLRDQVSAALNAVGLDTIPYNVSGTDCWPSAFAVSSLATASIGIACSELAALSGQTQPVTIDQRLASLWFSLTIQPDGWTLPPVWDDLAGIYEAKDGFVRLHTNAPHHKVAALNALQCEPSREAVDAHVAAQRAQDIERDIISHNGCAALLRSLNDWRTHPQGQAVHAEPLIAWTQTGLANCLWDIGPQERPLMGLKVLDLTRVLAGPICTRTLAGFGATVLRLDPPGWTEALVETDVTPGKHLATLDLKSINGRETFLSLLREADILVHGYRQDALDNLGLGEAVRRAINPNLIDVALNAYGWTGPWSTRRGFDSLVQMSSGIAHQGMVWAKADVPVPLPVQALDFATGYLMAATCLRALRVKRKEGRVLSGRLSLARTAALLASVPTDNDGSAFPEVNKRDVTDVIEHTDWGLARRIRFPANLPMIWNLPARRLHSDPAVWPHQE